jgi:hypothetical protein
MANPLNPSVDCVVTEQDSKHLCADFAALRISWDDIVALIGDLVPINGNVSNQSLCLNTARLE